MFVLFNYVDKRFGKKQRLIFTTYNYNTYIVQYLKKYRQHDHDHCLKNVRILSYSGPYSVRMLENADQNNSEYGHFSRSGDLVSYYNINIFFLNNHTQNVVEN